MGISTDIGRRIAHHRARLGLTQSQLAARIGVRQPSVGAWERGTSTPTLAKLPAIVEALELRSVLEFWKPIGVCSECGLPIDDSHEARHR